MSNTYLVSLSIGPVQDFIAAALRTRDLWFGSYMLSEVSKAVAYSMLKQDAELIFPAVTDLQRLKAGSELNVANRIIAEYTGTQEGVEQLMQQAKQAAQDQLSVFIQQAKRDYQKITKSELRDALWEQQDNPSDLLELYATWVNVGSHGYQKARQKLDRITAARKNSRDMMQPVIDPTGLGYGLPKSSLDGRRETVLPELLSSTHRQRLRMGEGEQLDLLGLVKRLAGGSKADQFTAITRIAIDHWIQQIAETQQGQDTLDAIGKQLEQLTPSGLVTHVKGNQGIYSALPFDAALLYKDRLDTAIRDCQPDKLDEKYKPFLKMLRSYLQPLWKKYGQPSPYYVLILADGDFMGKLLDKGKEKQQQKDISTLLEQFAQSVPETARQFRGHCIYAGGDDVLVMVPLNNAIALADELQKQFAGKLEDIAQQLKVDKLPTLSAGLVMTHMQTPLGRVRKLAAQAEKLAKGNDETQPRNALGITIDSRSGSELPLRIRWDDVETLTHFKQLITLYQQGDLPTTFGYELRQLHTLLGNIQDSDKERMNHIKQLELERILGRKNQQGGEKGIASETKDIVLQHADNLTFQAIFQQHLIARWLSAQGE